MTRQRVEAPIKGVTANQKGGVITALDQEDQPKIYSRSELTKMTKAKLQRVVAEKDLTVKNGDDASKDDLIVAVLESQKDQDSATGPEDDGEGEGDDEDE